MQPITPQTMVSAVAARVAARHLRRSRPRHHLGVQPGPGRERGRPDQHRAFSRRLLSRGISIHRIAAPEDAIASSPPPQTPGGAAGPSQGRPARQGSARRPTRVSPCPGTQPGVDRRAAPPSKVLSCQGFAAEPLSLWMVASPTVQAELKGRQKAFMVVEHPCGQRSHMRS